MKRDKPVYFSIFKKEENRSFSKKRRTRCWMRLTIFPNAYVPFSKFASENKFDATRLARFHAMHPRDNSRKRAERYTPRGRGSISLYRDPHLGPTLSNEPTTITRHHYTCETPFFSPPLYRRSLHTHTHEHTHTRTHTKYTQNTRMNTHKIHTNCTLSHELTIYTL